MLIYYIVERKEVSEETEKNPAHCASIIDYNYYCRDFVDSGWLAWVLYTFFVCALKLTIIIN